MSNSDKAWIIYQILGLSIVLGVSEYFGTKDNKYIVTAGYCVGTLISMWL